MREVRVRDISYDNSTALSQQMVELVQDKKGRSIVSLDLRHIPEAVSDYFIICHGDSSTQVRAIVDHVHRKLKEDQDERPHHIEGLQQSEWAIIDYTDVVLHVFLRDIRDHYQLEDLWSDAVVETFDDLF